jgi:hypothetical protein
MCGAAADVHFLRRLAMSARPVVDQCLEAEVNSTINSFVKDNELD